jgi:hypothetical protein
LGEGEQPLTAPLRGYALANAGHDTRVANQAGEAEISGFSKTGLPAMRSHGHWECEDLLSRYAVVSTKLISHFVK